VSSRREVLEEKSSGARNDYLLSLAAANAHQTRYFLVDLQNVMTVSKQILIKLLYLLPIYSSFMLIIGTIF